MSLHAPAVAPKSALGQPFRLLAGMLSLRYFLLRATTAGAALVFGLIQTFLFARQRERHLKKASNGAVPAQSSAVVLLYVLIVLAGTLVCFAAMASRTATDMWQAAQFAMFFAFAALNLVWFPLRNVSNAVDQFVYFESLEAIRRIGHIALMLALLVGLPL